MDLHLFGRVLWRFKYVVAAGFVVAILLSVLAVARISFSHGMPRLETRAAHVYQGTATLLVTQRGFPWGSALQTYSTPSKGGGGGPVPSGDLGRLTSLANLYAQIANSKMIAKLAAPQAQRGGLISATEGYSVSPTGYSTAMPEVIMNGTGTSVRGAIATTKAGVDALTSYLTTQQRAAGIPDGQRVLIQELNPPVPKTVIVLNPVKKTLPVVVFLTVMLAVVGLAFVLENLRPQAPRAVALRASADALPESARRSA